MCQNPSRLDGIVIDYAQRAKLDMLGIVVVGEGKAVPGIQPAVIGMTSVLRAVVVPSCLSSFDK